jgi:glutamyl-tRNA reductase
MTRVVVIGSHHGLVEPSRLPAADRARIALEARLAELKDEGAIRGGVALASCHRTEVVVEIDARHGLPARERFFGDLLDADVPIETFENRRAVEHLLRVAVGLDSVVVGEEQILGQLGESFRSADDRGLLGRTLHKLRTRLLKSARDLRQRLGLTGRNISSMAAVGARHLAERAGKRIAVVGAGETGRLALEQLARRDDLELYIVNRSLDRAQALARHHGATAIGLREFLAAPPELDGVLFAVSGTDAFCTPALARGWRMVVDLSLPTVVHDDTRAIEGLDVVDLDRIRELAGAEADVLADAIRDGGSQCKALAKQLFQELRGDANGQDFGRLIDLHVENAMAELQSALKGALSHLEESDQQQLRKLLERSARKTAHLHIQDVRRLVQERAHAEAEEGDAPAPLALTSRAG